MTNYVQAAINQKYQIGQEGSPGAGGSAGKVLKSWNIVPTEEYTAVEFMAPGRRFAQGEDPETEWTSFTFDGPAALYTEILYALEGIFGTVAPTLSGTRTETRIYTPALTGAVPGKTITVQWGDANNVYQFAYGVITEFGMKYDRKSGVSFSGAGFAQKETTGNTFTASPTSLTTQRILGKHINYYLDTTSGGLGTTQQQLTIMGAEWSYKGAYVPFWDSDRGQTSWAVPVDSPPTFEVKISFVENANTRSLVSNMVLGNTYYLRIDTTDSVNSIETGHAFSLLSDFAIQLTQKAAFGNKDAVLYRDLTFRVVEDPAGWGNAAKFTSVTDAASL